MTSSRKAAGCLLVLAHSSAGWKNTCLHPRTRQTKICGACVAAISQCRGRHGVSRLRRVAEEEMHLFRWLWCLRAGPVRAFKNFLCKKFGKIEDGCQHRPSPHPLTAVLSRRSEQQDQLRLRRNSGISFLASFVAA